MAKIYFIAFLALLAFVAVMANEQGDASYELPNDSEEYLSCQWGNAGCSASCAAQGHWRGGHCNAKRICICN